MGHDGAYEDLYMKLIKEGFKDRNYHCSKMEKVLQKKIQQIYMMNMQMK